MSQKIVTPGATITSIECDRCKGEHDADESPGRTRTHHRENRESSGGRGRERKSFLPLRRPMWAGAFDLIIKSRQVASSVSSPARWGRRFEISRPASFQNKVKTINLETQRKQRFFGIVTLTRDVRLT